MKSAPVATIAKQSAGWEESIPDLLEQVNVGTDETTLVLDISFIDADPRRATEGANVFAEAYLEYKRQRAVEAAASTRSAIQQQIDNALNRRDKLDSRIGTLVSGTAEYASAQQERDTINGQIAVLTSQLATVPAVSDPGEIILPATVPLAPSSPKHKIDVAMGFLFGAFIGIILAFVRDRTDERVGSLTDFEHVMRAPVLASIPQDEGSKKRGAVRLITEIQPGVQPPKRIEPSARRSWL